MKSGLKTTTTATKTGITIKFFKKGWRGGAGGLLFQQYTAYSYHRLQTGRQQEHKGNAE